MGLVIKNVKTDLLNAATCCQTCQQYLCKKEGEKKKSWAHLCKIHPQPNRSSSWSDDVIALCVLGWISPLKTAEDTLQ